MADVFTQSLNPSTTPKYSDHLTNYVRTALLDAIRAGLPWLPDGAVDYSAYKKGSTDTYILPGVGDLAETLQTASDEITPPPIEAIESYDVSFGTQTYYRAVGWSATLDRRAPYGPMGSIIAEKVRRAAEAVFDQVAFNAWTAGAANLPQLGVGTATLTRANLIDAATQLRALDVPPLPDGTYGLICRPEAVGDLLKESGTGANTVSLDLKEVDPNGLKTGVVGTLYGVKIITTTRMPVTATVAKGFIFGSGAFAFADVGSLQVYVSMPKPSLVDPTGRKGVAAFEVRAGGAIIGRRRTHNVATLVYNAAVLTHKVITMSGSITPFLAAAQTAVPPESGETGGPGSANRGIVTKAKAKSE